MKYLIDTCVLSEIVKSRPEKRVVNWMEGCDEFSLFLSVLSLGEIQKGIAKLGDARKKAVYQQWLDVDLKNRFAGRILPIDEEVALSWGIMQGKTEAAGRPLPAIDGLLGATAIVYNLTLVTRNITDLAATGAMVLNPWEN